MKPTTFWIKERHNPQLGTYYTACGRLSKKEAKRMEGSLYGYNIMIPFTSEQEYTAKIQELKSKGETVHL